MKTYALLLAAGFALTACAEPTRLTIDQIKAQLAGKNLGTSPILAAEIPELGAASTLRIVGRAGSVVTWQTPDEITLSFDSGFLVATRGLVDDLMTSDVAAVARGVFSGAPAGRYYDRLNEYIGGQDEVVKVVFQCTQTARISETIQTLNANRTVTRVSEECRSTSQNVENTYWVGTDGTMWKSVQWVSPLVGYLQTERLVR